jgi:hypothetical protein
MCWRLEQRVRDPEVCIVDRSPVELLWLEEIARA